MVWLRAPPACASLHVFCWRADSSRAHEALGGQQLAGGPVDEYLGDREERNADDRDGERVLRCGDGVQAAIGDRGGAGREAVMASFIIVQDSYS